MSLNYNAAVNISAHYSGEAAINRANRDIHSLSGTVKGAASLFKAFAAAYLVRETLQFGKSIINLGDSLNELRQKTGIGVQALSDLKTAAEKGGVDFGQLESSLRKFSVTIAKAGAGSTEAQAGFRALGLSLKEANGSMKSSDQLLFEIADKFAMIEDGPAKAAVAVALFGKSGSELIPVLNGGRDAIKGMGAQMSDEFVKQSDVFNDNLTELIKNTKQWGSTILEYILPAMNKWIGKFNEASKSGEWMQLLGSMFSRGAADTKPHGVNEALAEQRAMRNAGGTGKATINTKFLGGKEEIDKLKAEKDAVARLREEKRSLILLNELERDRVNMSEAEYQKKKLALEENLRAEQALVTFKDSKTTEAYRKETQAIIELKQAQIDQAEAQKQSFGAGAKQAIKEYADSLADVANQSKQLFMNAFHGIEDALVKFVQTGKLSFSDLAKSIEADLIRIAVRQAILRPLLGAVGLAFADGGVMTSGGPMELKKYASGGIARSPQLAMFGEGSKPEAFVPLPDGRSIPVSMSGGAGTSVSVNVNISRSGDAETKTDAQGDQRMGRDIGRALSSAITATLIKEKRPGGLLA